jgi:hypothetical protein
MRFQGKLTRSGKTVGVTGQISKLSTTAGIISWAGYIDSPSGMPELKIGDVAFLELESGESGNVRISAGTVGSSRLGRLKFKSNGPFGRP